MDYIIPDYYKKANIDIPRFWKNILKMSIPMLIVFIPTCIFNYMVFSTNIIIIGIEIINELFGGDINFLANIVHGSEKADDPEAGSLLPNGPVKTREPKHDLDLDFDDVNAYGDIVQ